MQTKTLLTRPIVLLAFLVGCAALAFGQASGNDSPASPQLSVRDGADQQLRRRYAELRMISRASRRSVEFLFAPSAIPCIKRSKLSVASRSTSCATVVSEGHAY